MKQIKIQNNVIDCYKKLKNDKEKSQFLLKIFKFIIENEEIITKNPLIEGMFLGVKPSLKLTEISENWGGKRNNAGNKINKIINQDENQDDSQDDNQVEIKLINQVPYKNKDISNKNKDISNKNKDISNKNKDIKYKDKQIDKDDNVAHNDKEIFIDYDFCKKTYNEGVENKVFSFTDFDKFWLYYKDKGILKSKLHSLMIRWDINWNKDNKAYANPMAVDINNIGW